MTRPVRAALAATAVLALGAGLLAAAPAQAKEKDPSKTPPSKTVPKLDWQPCEDGFECATALVPTDYDRPFGATTKIALIKLPAARPDQRIGSLFTNPGGPGGSGVDFVRQAGRVAFTQDVLDRYDVIGFDPRAVGASDPATCYASPEEEAAATAGFPAFPLTAQDAKEYLPVNAAFAASCKKYAGDRIAHASTANVARDMDLLRRAVGDPRLSYVGYSYGTQLGATYAALFPRKVGRLVLDGTIDPRAWSGTNGDRRPVGARIGQGPAAADTFQQFLQQCRSAGDACALNALGDPSEVVEGLLERLKTQPVEVPDGAGGTVAIDYPLAVASIFTSLYEPALWSSLATDLAGLAEPATARLKSSAPSTFTRTRDYPSVGGALASLCVDQPSKVPARAYQRLADSEDRKAPHFGRFRAWVGVQCATERFVDRDAYRGPWTQKTKQDVLVIGTRFDPATPYSATAPYTRLFPRGHMLTVEGYGHTILGKSSCADEAVAAYLIGGTTPTKGATCAQDVAPFSPTPAAKKELAERVVPAL